MLGLGLYLNHWYKLHILFNRHLGQEQNIKIVLNENANRPRAFPIITLDFD